MQKFSVSEVGGPRDQHIHFNCVNITSKIRKTITRLEVYRYTTTYVRSSITADQALTVNISVSVARRSRTMITPTTAATSTGG